MNFLRIKYAHKDLTVIVFRILLCCHQLFSCEIKQRLCAGNFFYELQSIKYTHTVATKHMSVRVFALFTTSCCCCCWNVSSTTPAFELRAARLEHWRENEVKKWLTTVKEKAQAQSQEEDGILWTLSRLQDISQFP